MTEAEVLDADVEEELDRVVRSGLAQGFDYPVMWAAIRRVALRRTGK